MCTEKFPVYLDYNATTPVDDRVLSRMLPFFTEHFGNASSANHAFGRNAAEAVRQAREEVAALIGAIPEEIIFTGGATESVNLAVKGVFEAYAAKGNHIITTQTEHAAVLDSCAAVQQKGAAITYVPVQKDGRVLPADIEKAIRPETILIAVMYANNETGVIQPVKEIGVVAKKNNILFFSDAAQAAGKIPVNVINDNIDLLALSAHKMYGPKGVGALYIRRKNPRVQLSAQLHGGKQEKGKRSGTLNVPGIVGFGAAAALCTGLMQEEIKRLSAFRDALEGHLEQAGAVVNGNKAFRLPHVTNIFFEGINTASLTGALYPNVAVSSGSACATGSPEPSHVLKAMGLNDEQARGALRLSAGRFTTEYEIQFAAEAITHAVQESKQNTAGMAGSV